MPLVGAHNGRPHSDPESDINFDHGVLHVEVLEARGIRGDEIKGMGRADPYLKVRHGVGTRRVTMLSHEHHNGGSNPTWNCLFKLPLRNGGTKDHNILEIEILNKNKRRRDTSLGHLRIGGLASWILSHQYWSTELAWYPVYYKHRRSNKDQSEERGEILMKFFFERVEEQVFARGHHTDATVEEIRVEPEIRMRRDIPQRKGHRVEGNKLSTIVGGSSFLISIAQTVIMFL